MKWKIGKQFFNITSNIDLFVSKPKIKYMVMSRNVAPKNNLKDLFEQVEEYKFLKVNIINKK